jgi:hypothetical protein
MRLLIASKSGSGRSRSLTAEKLVNLYAEKAPENAKANVFIIGSPGNTLFATCGAGPIRGQWAMAGVLYVVSGASLYSVDSAGTATSLGTINGNGLVTMADNGTQLYICTNSTDSVYSVAGGVVDITDPDFPGADSVDYLDGYFIFTSEAGGGQFGISAILDGTAYDALDFASAESAPDGLTRVFVDHREVLLFGTQTMEPWFDSGAADFPFERIPQSITEKGIASRFAIAKADNTTYWLDHTGVVRKLAQGYVPTRVSTHEIEYQMSRGDITTAEAFSYTMEGHECVAFTIPDTGTYIFDAATGIWHEHKSYGIDRWIVNSVTYIYGKQIGGDYNSGNLYQLSLDVYAENSNPLIAEMIFPPISNDGKRFILSSLTLDIEAGVGLESGADPLVTLQTSRDGKTWGTAESMSMGTVGNYTTQVMWNRLGQYINCHIRLLISSPVKRSLYTAFADIIPCDQ